LLRERFETSAGFGKVALRFFLLKKSVVFFFIFLGATSNTYGENLPLQVVKKVYLKKEKDICFLCMDFDEAVSFTPRVHTLSGGVKVLLSFNREVAVPTAKKISHKIIKGYFFEKFSPSSLMFIAALKENVTFLSKKYTKNSVKIGFRINKKHTVIIDAGHGGRDPGTKSITGNYEKSITLVTAIELRNALLASNRYKVYLTRDSDTFIPIEDRIKKINTLKADFLISLHTDSNDDKKLRGMSVYTLPNLDQLKNMPDVSVVDPGTYYKILSQSRKFAERLVGYIPNACRIKNRPCRNGELKILKADIPAVLIELGCISNKTDNELLHSQDFRSKAISAVKYALDNFFGDGKNESETDESH
jgi:N-acetylmuramoyl-L-alanine amidase